MIKYFIIYIILLFNFPVIAITDNHIPKRDSSHVLDIYQEIEEPMGRNQTQDEVEKFAIQKAKRLALENYGTLLSSKIIIINGELKIDKITAIALGIAKTKIVEAPIIITKNNIAHIRLKIKVSIDYLDLQNYIDKLPDNEKQEQINNNEKEIKKNQKAIEQLKIEIAKVNEAKLDNNNDLRKDITAKANINTNRIAIEHDILTDISFVHITGGCYKMGCGTWSTNCNNDERPILQKCVKTFWISRYETTQGLWKKIMNENPSIFKHGDNHPVENVSWYDVKQFIRKLNQLSTECIYRLPNEIEWEYACRSGGLKEIYSGGNNCDSFAWYTKNSGKSTQPVGNLNPNKIGLFDMSGNVWEWCENNFQDYNEDFNMMIEKTSLNIQPKSIRGGSWIGHSKSLRCSHRHYAHPNVHYSYIGFRLVKE